MRGISLLLMSAALANCAPTPLQQERTPQARAHLTDLLAGRSAQAPRACLSTFQADDMIIIDDNTVVFKDGGTYYRNDFRGLGCSQLSSPFYTMVTKHVGGAQLCSGDFADIRDTSTGAVVGSCVFGDFVAYPRPS